VGGQQHAPAALYPRERAGTHFTGGWVGTGIGICYGKGKGKIRLRTGDEAAEGE